MARAHTGKGGFHEPKTAALWYATAAARARVGGGG